MFNFKSATAAAILVGSVACAGAAQAQTVSIWAGTAANDPNALSTSSNSGFAQVNGLDGGFLISASILGAPVLDSPDLQTNSIDVKNTDGAGVLYIFATETGLTAPVGTFLTDSGFTENNLQGLVASVQEVTFIDPNNGAFNPASLTFAGQVASKTWTSIGSADVFSNGPNITGPYSVAVEYIITFTGKGSANASINLSDVPEPLSAALLVVGMTAVGVAARRRRSV